MFVNDEKKKKNSGATRVRTWVTGRLTSGERPEAFKILSDNHYTIAPCDKILVG